MELTAHWSRVTGGGTNPPNPNPVFTVTATAGSGGRVVISNGMNMTNTGALARGTFNRWDLVMLLAVAAEGFEFDGWFEGGVLVPSQLESFSFGANGNRTLEARFEPIRTVTFNPTGGQWVFPFLDNRAHSIRNGRPLLRLPQVSRAGFVFMGWFTAATGGERINENTVIRGNVTFFAQWAHAGQQMFTLTYNANGAIGSPVQPQNFMPGQAVTIAGHGHLSNGDEFFNGWQLQGNNDVIISWHRPSTGQNMLTNHVMLNSAILLNAEEEDATYATQNRLETQLTLGGERLCEEGLTFVDGRVDTLNAMQPLNGASALDGGRLFLPGDVVVFRGSVTLAAVWGAEPLGNTLTVTYMANNAFGLVPRTQHFTSGDEVTIAGPGNLRRDYEFFGGWKRSDNSEILVGGDVVEFPHSVTLVAQWARLTGDEDVRHLPTTN